MKLQDKYAELINTAKSAGIKNLQVREQENVLYIDGQAPSAEAKQKLWDVYGRIDPNFRSADVVMNVAVSPITPAPAMQEYEVVKGDNLTKIGKRYGVSWKEIYEANKNIISDPDLIQPGWKLKIPQKA
ncbi:MAG TPA: LysM peptidoglycan-binding domain-containing protein [Chitinophagaceae bacterium]|nr:LysM peptidoglycan-binding domain-containing protein [Chitinophagaceae bacterium]